MKVLMLAPHPFYQERGTPIAVDLLIRALTERGYQIDLLTFNDGNDVDYLWWRAGAYRSLPGQMHPAVYS